MGFQHLHPIVRRAVQRKGGKQGGIKGMAAMDEEKARQARSLGGIRSSEVRRNKKGKSKEGAGEERLSVETLLADVEEETFE